MTRRHVLLGLGLLGAGWLAFFGDKSPQAEVVAPVTRERTTTTAVVPVTDAFSLQRHVSATPAQADKAQIHALLPRETLIGVMQPGSRSELFASQSWTPPPAPVKAEPPPPPMAPPLPFAYLGKKIEDGQWEVFLGHGDQTLIVQEQMTLMETYRVESIKPPTLTLTYLPLKQVQTLTIGGAD